MSPDARVFENKMLDFLNRQSHISKADKRGYLFQLEFVHWNLFQGAMLIQGWHLLKWWA